MEKDVEQIKDVVDVRLQEKQGEGDDRTDTSNTKLVRKAAQSYWADTTQITYYLRSMKMDNKPWYFSKTVIASILIVAVSIMRILGRPEAEVVEAESEALSGWIVEAITLVLAAIAFFGRLTAKKQLTK